MSLYSRLRGNQLPGGELVMTTLPGARVAEVYTLVSQDKLLAGMCNALVCAAAV